MSKGISSLFSGASTPTPMKVPDPTPVAVTNVGQSGDTIATTKQKKKRGFESTLTNDTILGGIGQDTKRTLG